MGDHMDFFNNDKEFFEYAKTKLPIDDEEAQNRYNKYKSTDPFIDIEPALLNSSDIFRYVVATGMIYPFHPERAQFRGATYAAKLYGDTIYWDEKGQEIKKYIEDGKDEFIILKPNSITFVTLEPFFRIPDYIVLRFNLRIDHVYKGLLLGTGPIVDPGFCGRLSLPLHNLTLNSYKLFLGERLIWLEFTKLSNNQIWKSNKIEENLKDLKGYYLKYENKKIDNNEPISRTIKDYINEAVKDSIVEEDYNGSWVISDNDTVRNAVPEEIRIIKDTANNAQTSAKESEKTAKSINEEAGKVISYFKKFSLIAAISLFIGLVVLIITTFMLVQDATIYVKESRIDYENTIGNLQEEIAELRVDREENLRLIQKLQVDLDVLVNEINRIKDEGEYGDNDN